MGGGVFAILHSGFETMQQLSIVMFSCIFADMFVDYPDMEYLSSL